MTKTSLTTALKALETKVVVGAIIQIQDFAIALPGHGPKCFAAYANGSLDAAKALHEAVLPRWAFNLADTYCHVIPPHNGGECDAHTGNSDTAARAWLLAIIRALIVDKEFNRNAMSTTT